MYKKVTLLLIHVFIIISCTKKETQFTYIDSSKTGITFSNILSSNEDLNILNYLYYYNGSGVSAGDFNNDGLADLYFTANQSNDKLYLNTGDFTFSDITEASGIKNSTNWTTGSTTVDINNDGLLDIYISKIGDYNSITGHNLLFINQGITNGVPKFKEAAAEYNLDIQSFATQAVFFDYDQDNDLDLFLLNHSVHPNRNYGRGSLRTKQNALSGDKLYKNDNGTFTDVSSESGIFQGKIGYGLGVSVSDINNDGYPDLYIGNDFFENDYLYINQKDGSFKDVISTNETNLGHTSHFSMGNALEDINNDGHTDIVSLDMLPEDIQTYKSSGLEYAYPIYQNYLKNGYTSQYMQNTLHLNTGNNTFSETAHLSNIAATEWSWSPVVADFDNDGFKDLYITNGILGATNDMDFINFISNEEIQKRLGSNMQKEDLSLISKIPQKKVANYLFKNNGDNTFQNVTEKWLEPEESFSNGATHVDLDNDGDLDIVVNNVNEVAYVLKNNTEIFNPENKHLKIHFKGPKQNNFGIGAKIIAYTSLHTITQENYVTKGYLSSVEPKITLGLGKSSTVDSLTVIWTDGSYQSLKTIEVNKLLILDYKDSRGNYYAEAKNKTSTSKLLNSKPLISFKHKDQTSIEFNRDPLVPFASTNKGPHISVADINNDTLDDVFISGGKTQASQLFIQSETGSFKLSQEAVFDASSINEDVSHTFFDANNDGFKDLLVVSGGNEFKSGSPLKPRLYTNNNGHFILDTLQFKTHQINASKVKPIDFDNDGDLDISITSNTIPRQFGVTPKQYFFENDGKGNFTDTSESLGSDYINAGNVEDILWIDINKDGFKDCILVGKWMPIKLFINANGKKLTLQKSSSLDKTNGWWNSINAADFDKDGDIDLVVGNWGLNTRLKASEEEPITLYNYDFDGNGKIDPLVTYFYQGFETPFASKDELVKQLPFLNKEFLSYNEFAKASLNDLFSNNLLKQAQKKYVYTLASSYLENLSDGNFKIHQLPFSSQVSSVNDSYIDDFNNDGYFDIFLAGNDYEISTQLGKLDASHGTLLLNDKEGFFTNTKQDNFNVSGPARAIEKIRVNDAVYYIISINNDQPIFLKKRLINDTEKENQL